MPTQEPNRRGQPQRRRASRKQSPNLLQHWAHLQTLHTETQIQHKPQLRTLDVNQEIHDCTVQKLHSPVPEPRCTAPPPTDYLSLIWWRLVLTANLWWKETSLRKWLTHAKKVQIWWERNPKPHQRADPERERGGYGMLRSLCTSQLTERRSKSRWW